MSKRKIVALAGLFVLALLLSIWAGVMTRSARITVAELLLAWDQGEMPQGLTPPVQVLGENLIEFGTPGAQVGRVRLNSPFDASAEVELSIDSQAVVLSLNLELIGWRWKLVAAPDTKIQVVMYQQPQLALVIDGEPALTRELELLGSDKLLTVQAGRSEWLNRGWLERPPYFASFHQREPTGLIVGMEDLVLYAHAHRLAAVVAPVPFVPERIRVNISTTGHTGIRHSTVSIGFPSNWQIIEAVTGNILTLPPGEVTLHPMGEGIALSSNNGEDYFAHRLIFSSKDHGRLELSSITRAGGRRPAYQGTLEVANFGGELVIVNELPLEQYLYAVVPSEMPASFGTKSLEVQAIAARTYAVRNVMASGWRSTSAHVVDSVLSQVYNNIGENFPSTAAVDATRGEIVAMEGRPVDVKFFSTSSGYTASSHQVWPDGSGNFPGKPVAWLTSRPQHLGLPSSIGTEDVYKDFIRNPLPGAYDANSAWFRWRVTVPIGQLAGIAQENLIQIHRSSPGSVLKRDTHGNFHPVETIPEEPLGELLDLISAQRGDGGVLMAVDLVGVNGIWRVQREYYIRHVLRPMGTSAKPIDLIRHDGSRLQNFTLLPSAFVAWEMDWSGEILKSVTFNGGGFGHGVGMSQNGVRELVNRGWTREQIIQHYFPGTEIGNVYR